MEVTDKISINGIFSCYQSPSRVYWEEHLLSKALSEFIWTHCICKNDPSKKDFGPQLGNQVCWVSGLNLAYLIHYCSSHVYWLWLFGKEIKITNEVREITVGFFKNCAHLRPVRSYFDVENYVHNYFLSKHKQFEKVVLHSRKNHPKRLTLLIWNWMDTIQRINGL